MCTYALGSFFSQSRMRKPLSYAWESYIFVFLRFGFMAQESFYLCPLSRSVPLRFYVNSSYQRFSL